MSSEEEEERSSSASVACLPLQPPLSDRVSVWLAVGCAVCGALLQLLVGVSVWAALTRAVCVWCALYYCYCVATVRLLRVPPLRPSYARRTLSAARHFALRSLLDDWCRSAALLLLWRRGARSAGALAAALLLAALLANSASLPPVMAAAVYAARQAM